MDHYCKRHNDIKRCTLTEELGTNGSTTRLGQSDALNKISTHLFIAKMFPNRNEENFKAAMRLGERDAQQYEDVGGDEREM